MFMHPALRNRIFPLNRQEPADGPVICWMSRDQRLRDNPALLHAQEVALMNKVPLVILFCLNHEFMGATLRPFDFMLKGLAEVERDAAVLNIPFFIRTGNPADSVVRFADEVRAGMVVTDFSPLRIHLEWKHAAAKRLEIPLYEVDAHNIIPARAASPKAEFAARTLRPVVRRLLPEYMTECPSPVSHPYSLQESLKGTEWHELYDFIQVDRAVTPVNWLHPGENAAAAALDLFVVSGLKSYVTDRNNPVIRGQSDLSPYLHFGQISAMRVALRVSETGLSESTEAFLEELIVRRELSDNFCLYNSSYDTYEGIPAWGRRTLQQHWDDRRSHLYSLEQFEDASTHDPLWNAAQQEMVINGKMHGYMRMYWAKKILEWSRTPEEAFAIAVHLNDKFSLDGRDPNGYAGISWSIGGTHDRPWKERPVFGMVRYMNYEGCARKFDVPAYIRKITNGAL